MTPTSITTLDRLLEDLAATRRQGYGIDDEESGLGNVCFAAPIRDATRRTIAALSVSGLASVVRDELRPLILEVLLTEAAHLSEELGYHPAWVQLSVAT